MSRFELRDSRRLTGPNVIWDKPGPVMDIALEDSDRELAEQTWERYARLLMNALGWEKEETATRHFPGGLSLAFSAPMDVLYSACEVNEVAWAMAVAEIEGSEIPDFNGEVEEWKAEVRKERNPPLLRIQRAAQKRNKIFLTCDDEVSVGAGRWSRTWPVKRLPETGDIDWDKISSIPIAMVTG
ncbi:MAG: Mur ligase, partial [Planctomycetota bacterium]|nr:Mur ligase [Planctomycetota bacterium]